MVSGHREECPVHGQLKPGQWETADPPAPPLAYCIVELDDGDMCGQTTTQLQLSGPQTRWGAQTG